MEAGVNNYFNNLGKLLHGHHNLKSLRFVAHGFKLDLEKNTSSDEDADDENNSIDLMPLKLENFLKKIMTDSPYLIS